MDFFLLTSVSDLIDPLHIFRCISQNRKKGSALASEGLDLKATLW